MKLDTRPPGFWRAACVALGTGALFMLVYHLCNAVAAASGRTQRWYWEWELNIPVVDWLIVPYWSIDLLFVVAPFLCTRRSELRVLAWRISLAILIAGACFIAWPLELVHPRTADHGIFTPFFQAIHSVDKPHNLFPSLHIAFAVILRWTFDRHLRGWARWAFHAWFACISASAILVHQHHIVDVLGGAVLAILCCYMVTEEWIVPARHAVDARSLRHSLAYAAGAAVCMAIAWFVGGWSWLLAWPALSLALIALAHVGPGAAVFRKGPDGLPAHARLVLAPYLAGLTLSRWYWWGRDRDHAVLVADGVWVGRLPDRGLIARIGVTCVLDLTAEHAGVGAPPGVTVEHVPMLDVATPTPDALARATEAIERLRQQGPVLVHCALGYGRSVAAVSAWMVATGRAHSEPAAAHAIQRKPPTIRPMAEEAAPLPGRRPLKARSRAWTKQLAALLVSWRISPNAISALSIVFAAGAAAALVCWPFVDGWLRAAVFVAAGTCIQFRLLCNLLDGMVAVEGGLRSPLGDLFNEVPDRIADSLILIALGYGVRLGADDQAVPYAVALGWAAALLAMLTAYVRALGGSLGTPSCFHGPMAKPHRMALVTGACAAAALACEWVNLPWILWGTLVAIVLGCVVTCARRLAAIARHLRGRAA